MLKTKQNKLTNNNNKIGSRVQLTSPQYTERICRQSPGICSGLRREDSQGRLCSCLVRVSSEFRQTCLRNAQREQKKQWTYDGIQETLTSFCFVLF